jgi:hypothetical protein
MEEYRRRIAARAERGWADQSARTFAMVTRTPTGPELQVYVNGVRLVDVPLSLQEMLYLMEQLAREARA